MNLFPYQKRQQPRPPTWSVEFTGAVNAMQLHDLLIWDVPLERRNVVHVRLRECHHSEFMTVSRWYNGKLFIVRVL